MGPALPEPFVQFELETELVKSGLLPVTTGSQGRDLQSLWEGYRCKLRELVSGGPRRVRNHVIEPLLTRLGYEGISDAEEVQTREGPEDAGAVLVASDGASVRLWCTEYSEDLDAPTRRGAAYRFSHLQVARRVLKAKQERIGLLTNGVELRIIILDLARTDSEIIIRIDPAWKDRRATEPLDSFLLFLALSSPQGVRAIPDLVDKARLQQARVTKELRRQAREAVEGFLQEVLNHPDNQSKLGDLSARHELAPELWREALIVVYRLLFVLKLEATDDPARSFKFSTSTLWRNTFSPTSALPRFVRKLLDEGAPSGNLIEQSVRKLFQMFVDGLECSELHVRPLGGTLFGLEATPLLSDLKWGERGVAWLLDRLLWTSPKRNSQGRERVHYGSLDVEDLGRVYEALLELDPGVATEDMCRLRRSKLELVVPAVQGERYRPTDTPQSEVEQGDDEEAENEEESEEPVRGSGRKVEWIEHIPAGQFYLRVGLGRKASGSYYTPQSFVKFLVQQTLETIVAARSPKENPQPAEILKIKVLDPAMGSGHFLVEACRFLGGKLYEATRLCDERLEQAMRTLEAAQNAEIRAKAVRDVADYGQRLAAFLPPEAKLSGYLPSRAPEAGGSSGISQKQAEAICRRLVTIHCLYGVDKNPLGVELAKVALWLEAHSEGFPLTFLDHRLVLGDSITGPFFDRLLKYPGSNEPMNDLLTQGLQEKFSAVLSDSIALVQEIESTLCSTMPDFEKKTILRKRLETRLAPFKVVAAAWAGGVMLPERCDDDGYAALVRTVADTGNLPDQINSQRLRDMITQGLGLRGIPEQSEDLLEQLARGNCIPALPFDLHFTEVFFPNGLAAGGRGFDVVLGNPPWDKMLPADKEFFTSFELSILNAATKKERESIQKRLLLRPEIKRLYDEYVSSFRAGDNIIETLYRFQVVEVYGERTIGKQDAFRAFMERNYHCLRNGGVTGVVVPSAFHANEGATGIRRLYLQEMAQRYCYSFQNKRKLFEIHPQFKFATVIAEKGHATSSFSCAFYLQDDKWLFSEQRQPPPLEYSRTFVERTGGEYLSFLELRSLDSFKVAEVCYSHSEAFGRVAQRLGIELGRELNMTDDAWRFSDTQDILGAGVDPRDPKVCADLISQGYLLIAEGKSFWHFDDRWSDEVRSLASIERLSNKPDWLANARYFRLAYRAIQNAENERTLTLMILPPGRVFGNSANCDRRPEEAANWKRLYLQAATSSFVADWLLRLKTTANVNLFILDQLAFPRSLDALGGFLSHSALRLNCNHAGYTPLWREQLGEVWRESGPKFTWPVLSGDDVRWDLRAAIDAVVANKYGLSRTQYEHVLGAFSHKSYSLAATACLTKFDELMDIGIEAYVRKYDPYCDIPLNENLPEPVINIPISVPTRRDGQHSLSFADGSTAPHIGRQSMLGITDELYQKLCELITDKRQITNADVQSTLGCTAVQARTMLKRLVEENCAVVEGRGRSTRYVAVSSAEARNAHPTGRAS
jgi:hypothetical protein